MLDDERLKQGKHFGKDYFDDLLERILRNTGFGTPILSKKSLMYMPNKSADYDSKSETTQLFFKDSTEYDALAVTHQTVAEIVYSKSRCRNAHMGLTTWKNAPDGRVQSQTQ